jgi:hypothetical protein
MLDNTNRRPLDVIVTVFDLKLSEEIRRHEFNYHSPNRRAWFLKLCVWAWSNGHSVEVFNKADESLAEG